MNTNQYRGASARRILLSDAPGAGGFAGHSVPLADPNRVVGGSGFNAETNPVRVHNDEGQVIEYPRQDGTYRPAHFEVVESWRRDPIAFPDPHTFRLKFSKPLLGVFALEVLEINVPNVDGGATNPANREFLLLNGLLKAVAIPAVDGGGTRYNFQPQDQIPKDRSFHTMITHNANDPNVDRSDAAWDIVDHVQLDDYALGRYQYDSTKPYQHWNRTGWHRKTWFPTIIDQLDYLDFALADPLGNAYIMTTGAEWSATLQIFSKS